MKSFFDLKNDLELRKIEMYRIFGVERLFQIINDKSLVLLSPGKWEDPYEKSLQELLETKNNNKIYGLCWSSRSRSDALWRIYSPNALGVRISTTVGNIVDSMLAGDRQFEANNFFVGAVTYLPESTKKSEPNTALGKHALSLDGSHFDRNIFTIADAIEDMLGEKGKKDRRKPSEIAKTFLVKRLAFDHESEIRMIYVDGENIASPNGTYKIKLDPLKLIRSIQFDPRMKDDVYLALRKAVNANTGDYRIRMSKSDLYKSPTKLISK
jgi:hypothetical protein